MKNFHSKLPAALYYLIGAGSFLFGLFLFYQTLSTAHENHVEMELGSALVFTGLVCFWCGSDFGRPKAVRFFVIVFFTLLALVHWLEFFAGNLPVASPLYNSLPMAGLVIAELMIGKQRKVNVAA